MKYLILAALLAASAGLSVTSVAAADRQSSSASAPNYQDARSTASDEDVRVARRAYRAACERHSSTGYCECMTGGMAQTLPPSELAVATAAFTGAHVNASAEVRAHVESVRAQIDHGCASFH